jgi:hypothetical protein
MSLKDVQSYLDMRELQKKNPHYHHRTELYFLNAAKGLIITH